jgi:hypothetical protein
MFGIPAIKFRRLLLIFFGILLVIWLVFLIRSYRNDNLNALAIGTRSEVDSVAIALLNPTEFDSMSSEDILSLRQQAVALHPELFVGKYRPYRNVFGSIDSGAPWWGTNGEYYYGSGEQSVDGPSVQSKYVLNPYILVATDISSLSFGGSDQAAFWNKGIISDVALKSSKFPYYCKAQELHWWPGAQRAEMTYNIKAYLAELNNWTNRTYRVSDASLSLTAYNARDFNLNYLYVDYDHSINVYRDNPPASSTAISDVLEKNDTCGYPGGCNTANSPSDALSGIKIEGLPATLVIYLWGRQPDSVQAAPDMTFAIHYK